MRSLVFALSLLVAVLVVSVTPSCSHDHHGHEHGHGHGEGHEGCSCHGGCHGHYGICQLTFTNASVACQDDCPEDFNCAVLTDVILPAKRVEIMEKLGLNVNAIHICKRSVPVACADDSECTGGEKCVGRWESPKACYPVGGGTSAPACGGAAAGASCSLTCPAGAASCTHGTCVEGKDGAADVCLPQCRAFMVVSHRKYESDSHSGH